MFVLALGEEKALRTWQHGNDWKTDSDVKKETDDYVSKVEQIEWGIL